MPAPPKSPTSSLPGSAMKKAATYKGASAFKKTKSKSQQGSRDSPTEHLFGMSEKGGQQTSKQVALDPSTKSRMRRTKQDASTNLVNSPDMFASTGGSTSRKKRRQKVRRACSMRTFLIWSLWSKCREG